MTGTREGAPADRGRGRGSRLLTWIDRWTSRPLPALIGADSALLALEHASDDELRATGDLHRGIREAALGDQSGPVR